MGCRSAGVAAGLPVSWPTVHQAFVAHAEATVSDPSPPAVLGIDETRRGRPRWTRDEAGGWVRLERFETNFVDLAGDGGLLGQTAGRTGMSQGSDCCRTGSHSTIANCDYTLRGL